LVTFSYQMIQSRTGKWRRSRHVGSAIEWGIEALAKASSSCASRRYHKGPILAKISQLVTSPGRGQEGEEETIANKL